MQLEVVSAIEPGFVGLEPDTASRTWMQQGEEAALGVVDCVELDCCFGSVDLFHQAQMC